MNINAVLNIQIALQSLANILPSFGTTLILTRDATGPVGKGLVFAYTSIAGVLADWGITSKAYLKAQVFFAQNPSGTTLLVGQGNAAVAQVDTITVAVKDDAHLYVASVNGFPFSYQAGGADTAIQIAAALETAAAVVIAAQALPITAAAAGGTNHFSLTSTTAGYGFTTTTADTDLTLVHTTPATNGPSDIAAIKNGSVLGKSWYCLEVTSDYKNNTDLEALADYIETQPNIFVVADPNTSADNTAGSFAAYCQSKSYNQTMVIAQTLAVHIDAAVASVNLTFTPGAKNWAYTQVASVPADNYTDTEIANLNAVNCNYYVALGNGTGGNVPNVFFKGIVGSGQYIDTILGRDWIKFNLQQNLLNLFLTTPIVNYDDHGLSMIGNVVSNTLAQAVAMGILAPSTAMPLGFVVNIPPASTISAAQKATRVFTACSWSGNLAGAIDGLVPVTGTLGFF